MKIQKKNTLLLIRYSCNKKNGEERIGRKSLMLKISEFLCDPLNDLIKEIK